MLCATLISLALTASALANAALKVTITGAESFVGVANAVVTATVTNTGNETVSVLNDPSTVLGKLPTDIFAISNEDGSRPSFKGVAAKYIPNLDQGITTLLPGQSVSVEHSLADAYDFSASGPGVYTIDTSPLFHIVNSGGLEEAHATVVRHWARLSGDLVAAAHRPTKRATFIGCSGPRQEALNAASQGANLLVQNAEDYLASTLSEPTRYTTWFGIKTAPRFATVKAHFGALGNLNFASFTYDCTCTDPNIAAKTFPNTPTKISICPSYFNLGVTGGGSQPGVLIQQAVQWNSVASASPLFATGTQDCLALARDAPEQAIENADSHEYFAENALT